MNQLKKKYELVNPVEKPIDTDEYFRKAKEEYASILSYDYHESIYQKFLKKIQHFFLVHMKLLETQRVMLPI